MSIILEGPDGGGKTSLAQDLKDGGLLYVHHGVYPDDTPEQNFERYRKTIAQAYLVQTVVDRCHLSEFVYGMVMRGHCRLSDAQLAGLNNLCNHFQIKQVVCLPPWPTALANWAAKNALKEDYVDSLGKYEQVYRMYEELADKLGLEVYDYTLGEEFIL